MPLRRLDPSSPHIGMPLNPREEKRVRCIVRGFDSAAWDRERLNVSLEGNYAKYQ